MTPSAAPDRAPLAVTMGEPAGIGGEVALKAWLRRGELPPFLVIDDADRLQRIAHELRIDVPVRTVTTPTEAPNIFSEALPVLHQPLPVKSVAGRPIPENAPAVVASIESAVRLARSGAAAAVVTNPISKEALYGCGFTFPGHTEFLGALAGDNATPVMMLACAELRVVPVTIHVSLAEAIRTLDTDRIVDAATVTDNALKRDFGIAQPLLAIAGLNPHAGEGGAMGDEDAEIVAPAVAELRARGIDAFGPAPPDTLFAPAARSGYDAAICMYHDQALIPLKTLDFDGGVNVTLGLPFVRTSPGHGTAFDIAGTGRAREASLVAALRMAAAIAAHRAAARM